MEGVTSGGGVRVVSRRTVRPSTPPLKEEVVVIHLTPLDLRLIRTDSLQKGVLMPKPPVSGASLVNALEPSFARALRLFYPFAGRLAAEERGDGTLTVSLRCTGEGAEFVHATAPGVAAADIVSSVYTRSVVRDELHSFDPALGADAAVEALPLVSVQVTELADSVFIGMTLNHSVADGAALWHFFNTWAEIHRRGSVAGDDLSTPAPVLQRWFVETWPVSIPLPFGKLEDIARQVKRTTVREAIFTFSTASVTELTARANGEIAGTAATAAAAAISSLQAVLAHLWRAVCRARRMPPEQGTSYSVLIDCRGRVKGIPPGYVGNAAAFGKAEATVGEIEGRGLGWTAWLLNRAEASFDEASRERVGVGGAVGPAAGAHVHHRPDLRRHGVGDRKLAVVRRVRERLRVGEAGDHAERRGEQDGRQGGGVRGSRAGRGHVAGAVLGAGRAGEAPHRRGVHGRGELAGVRVDRAVMGHF